MSRVDRRLAALAGAVLLLEGCLDSRGERRPPAVVPEDDAGPEAVGGCPDAGVVRVPPGCLVINPQNIDFGDVLFHQSAIYSTVVVNKCGIPINLLVGAMRGPDAELFLTDPPPGTPVAIEGAPDAPGRSGEGAVAITLNFSPETPSLDFSQASFALSICGCPGNCDQLVSLRGTGVSSGIWMDTDHLDFGFVPPMLSDTRSMNLGDLVNTPYHLTSDPVVINTTDAGTAPVFRLGAGSPGAHSAVQQGSMTEFSIVFTPPTAGLFEGELDLATDDPEGAKLKIALKGYGGREAEIACFPLSLSFGSQPVGSTSSLDIVCTNVGEDLPGHPEANLFIPDPASGYAVLFTERDEPFHVAFAAPFPSVGLAAGQSTTIRVTFSTTYAAAYEDKLWIPSSDTIHPVLSVPLSATAY